jgi:hypothetical protein
MSLDSSAELRHALPTQKNQFNAGNQRKCLYFSGLYSNNRHA